MARWTLLALATSLACASGIPETVPLVGAMGDVSSLVGEWSGEYDGGASGRSGSIVFVLRIAFVGVANDAVTGTLDPDTDPDCKCTVQTTFTGTVRGNTIEGTFVTRGSQLPAEQTGRWRVTKG